MTIRPMRSVAIAVMWLMALHAAAWSHPLDDTAWTGDGSKTAYADFETRAAAADFVLVGEIHDNSAHHAIQADIIRAMAAAGREPAVVFEMVPKSLQPVLDAIMAAPAPDLDALGEDLRWTERGWPDWAIYRPIFEVALEYDLPLVAGDLDRGVIRDIGKGSLTIESGVTYSEEIRARLAEELMAAHCDLLPEEAIAPMIDVQLARDLSMATAMLDAGRSDGAVLIAGAGHARGDWGVPFILRSKAPDADAVSIGLFEVSGDAPRFADYEDTAGDGLPFDFVLFTERSETRDHCAELERQLDRN